MNEEIKYYTAGYIGLVPCAEGIYFDLGFYLYFYDYTTQEIFPVCNKPDCLHDMETDQQKGQECNAFVCSGKSGGSLARPLFYHDGYLYAYQANFFWDAFANEKSLIRIAKDGSTREKVFSFLSEEYNSGILHEGFLYCSKQKDPGIYVKDLSNADDYSLLDEQLNLFEGIYGLFIHKDKLFFSAEVYHHEDKDQYETVASYDLNDHTLIVYGEGIASDPGVTILDDNTIICDKDRKTYAYDLTTHEMTHLTDDSGSYYVSDKYLFVYNLEYYEYREGEKRITIFDKELNYITEFILPNGYNIFAQGTINDELYIRFYRDKNTEGDRLYEGYAKFTVVENEVKKTIIKEVDSESLNLMGYEKISE